MVTIPIHQSSSKKRGDALTEHVFRKNSIPENMTVDQDSAFLPTLINYLFTTLGIKIKTVASYDYQSLQAEHGIKTFATILTKYLTG